MLIGLVRVDRVLFVKIDRVKPIQKIGIEAEGVLFFPLGHGEVHQPPQKYFKEPVSFTAFIIIKQVGPWFPRSFVNPAAIE